MIHSDKPQSWPEGLLFSHILSVRPFPLYKSSKTKQQKTMFANGEIVGLTKWIIDNACLVFYYHCNV